MSDTTGMLCAQLRGIAEHLRAVYPKLHGDADIIDRARGILESTALRAQGEPGETARVPREMLLRWQTAFPVLRNTLATARLGGVEVAQQMVDECNALVAARRA